MLTQTSIGPNGSAALDWPSPGEIDSCDVYSRYAESYDALFGNLDVDARFYLAAAKVHVSAKDKLLELGAGSGRLTAHLLESGHRIVGLDTSREMLALASARFDGHDRLELVCADVRDFDLHGTSFPLAIAPYGMVAHLLTDEDRLATFRTVHAHLKPGGVFIFDDCPSWLKDPDDGTALHVSLLRDDPSGDGTIRLMTNTIEAADVPVSIRYDFIDRIDRVGRVTKRTVVRIVFRNIGLAAELQLLDQAGFHRVDVLGGFDGRPLDVANPGANARLVLRCHREA